MSESPGCRNCRSCRTRHRHYQKRWLGTLFVRSLPMSVARNKLSRSSLSRSYLSPPARSFVLFIHGDVGVCWCVCVWAVGVQLCAQPSQVGDARVQHGRGLARRGVHTTRARRVRRQPGKQRGMAGTPRPGMPQPLGPVENDLAAQTTRTSCKRRLRDSCSSVMLVPDRLPAKTLLYLIVEEQHLKQRADVQGTAVVPRQVDDDFGSGDNGEADQLAASLLPSPGEPLSMTAPPAPSDGNALHVREYMLLRPVHLARGSAHVAHGAIESSGLDGWRSDDCRWVGFVTPKDVLLLVDDDKQTRLAQTFLPDMFMRLGLQGRGECPTN